jgi:hypothetical protein
VKWLDRIKNKPAFIKLLNWEYWPSKAFYYPVVPYILWLMFRARHICFSSAANPGIYTGGIGLESKYETLLKVPEALRPVSILIKKETAPGKALAEMQRMGLSFPIIAKPDLGFRGLLVKKITDEEGLADYLDRYPIDCILQELIELPEEVGVFYYRFPDEGKGHISSLTTKEFLSVTGDGQHTLSELISNNPRAILQLPRIQAQMPDMLHHIPSLGEEVNLGIIGNHAKGTRFINSNELIDEQMVATIDRISQQIEGFYYGRFDMKCASLDSLRTGVGLKVIELNGTCSEPTHIYDPQKGTYFSAIRAIARNWSIIYRIARANRRKGIRYESHKKIANEFLNLFAYQKMIKELGGD